MNENAGMGCCSEATRPCPGMPRWKKLSNMGELIDVAMGRAPADLVVKNGRIVDVFVGDVYEGDVAVKGDRIAVVGDAAYTIGDRTQVVDAEGKYITPGLMDAHMHEAGSHIGMTEFARALLLHGTTGIVTDFFHIGIVSGVRGIQFCLEECNRTPLKIFYQVASQIYIQNGPHGNTGRITRDDLKLLLALPDCVGISEWPFLSVVDKDPVVLDFIQAALDSGKLMLGHVSETPLRALNAYACAGATCDHESVAVDEAIQKLRLGMRVCVRQGTAARDLVTVIKCLTERRADPHFFMFASDEEDPVRLAELGHIDYKIRMSIQNGASPVAAVQMGTINVADYLGCSQHLGSITPGKVADLVFVRSLPEFEVSDVVADGRLVVSNGEYVGKLERPTYPDWMRGTVRLGRTLKPEDFEIRVGSGRDSVTVRVIGQEEGRLITESRTATLRVADGCVKCDPARDIIKIAIMDRHGASGQMGVAFVQGFGLWEGAVASTFNPQLEDVVVIGASEPDMARAVNRLTEIDGGFVVVANGRVVSELRLPLFGMLSDMPLQQVVDNFRELNAAIQRLGCKLSGPMTQLALLCVPIEIGTLKLSRKGLVDVWSGKHLDVVVE